MAEQPTIKMDKRPQCKARSTNGFVCELHKGHESKHFAIDGHPMRPVEWEWTPVEWEWDRRAT